MGTRTPVGRIEAVRRFNRFYTRQIGVLQEHLLASPFSLTEARVLYEVAHHDDTTERAPSATDGRQRLLRVTRRGRQAFATLDGQSTRSVRALLLPRADEAQARLIDSMRTIEAILGAQQPTPPYVVRSPRPGDMGWVVQRH